MFYFPPSGPEGEMRELTLTDSDTDSRPNEDEERSEANTAGDSTPPDNREYEALDSDEEEQERERIMRSLDASLVSESEQGSSELIAPRFKSVHNLSNLDDEVTGSSDSIGSTKGKRRRKPKSTLGWQGFASSQQDMRNISEPGYGRQDSDAVVRTSLLLAESQLQQLSNARLLEIRNGLNENIAEMWKAFHAQEELSFYLQSKNNAHQVSMARLLEEMNDSTQELASIALAREESLRQAESAEQEALRAAEESLQFEAYNSDSIHQSAEEVHQNPLLDTSDTTKVGGADGDSQSTTHRLPTNDGECRQSNETAPPVQQQGFLARMFSGQP